MFKSLTEDEFKSKLNAYGIKHIPMEMYRGAHVSIKWMCNKNKDHVFELPPCIMYRNREHCPYCARQKVFVGETDLWSTRPDIAKLLVNPEDGYRLMDGSGIRVDWRCPECEKIIHGKTPKIICLSGFVCPYCGDGRSYGEKFIASMFEQLNCNVIFDRTMSWSQGRRYDFYIPDMDIIVEVHGIQHYSRSFRGEFSRNTRTVEEEQQNDMIKQQLAISNGIKHYIQLDCRKSELEYIRKSIIESELNKIFDLSKVDWFLCGKATLTSNIVRCARLWNDGMTNTQEIANASGIHISSVLSNLKKASQLGLCNFVLNYKKNQNRYKPVMCIETGKIYECLQRVNIDGYNGAYVSACCNHKRETAYGLHWRFI